MLDTVTPTPLVNPPGATTPEQQPAVVVAPVDPSAPPAAQETGETTDAAAPARDDKGRFTQRTEQIQRQISDLTARKHAEKRELEALQRQTSALRQQYQATQKIDPNDFEASEMGRTQRAVIGVQHGLAQQQTADAEQRIAELRSATFMAKVDQARERIPDIDQTLAAFSNLPVSNFAADLIAESDRAVEIANYLGRNPHEAIRISRLPSEYQGVEIARIENRVAAMPVKRISQAPAPVNTVSGGVGSPGADLSSLSMADYIKARENQSR